MPDSNPGPMPQKSGALSMSHHIYWKKEYISCVHVITLNTMLFSAQAWNKLKITFFFRAGAEVRAKADYFCFSEHTHHVALSCAKTPIQKNRVFSLRLQKKLVFMFLSSLNQTLDFAPSGQYDVSVAMLDDFFELKLRIQNASR